MRRASWLLMATVAVAAWAADRTIYRTDDPYHRDVVTITSEAPLSTIVTRSQEVRGSVTVDPQNVLNHPEARFEVAVESLSTGIALRDEHLRSEGWLDARAHPTVVFSLKQVKTPTRATALQPGQPLALDVVGTLELHGKAADVPARLEVTLLPKDEANAKYMPGDLLRVTADFELLLSDFGVEIPETATRMVANRQRVHVALLASTQRMVTDLDHQG